MSVYQGPPGTGKSFSLVAGTSHSFQGDERDHIILSLALDDNSPEGARRFDEWLHRKNKVIEFSRNLE